MFNYKRKSRIFLIVLMLFSFITSCTVGTNSKNEIAIDGSSTVFPITQAVAEEYHKQYPSAEISVGVSGTGGGMKKFCSGELDIANASRPIKDEELKSCEEKKIKFVELPIALDGAAIVVNKNWTLDIFRFFASQIHPLANDRRIDIHSCKNYDKLGNDRSCSFSRLALFYH